MPKWKPFELAVLNSLYRLERRGEAIQQGINELLREGPNDQDLQRRLAELARELDDSSSELKKAVEANQP